MNQPYYEPRDRGDQHPPYQGGMGDQHPPYQGGIKGGSKER